MFKHLIFIFAIITSWNHIKFLQSRCQWFASMVKILNLVSLQHGTSRFLFTSTISASEWRVHSVSSQLRSTSSSSSLCHVDVLNSSGGFFRPGPGWVLQAFGCYSHPLPPDMFHPQLDWLCCPQERCKPASIASVRKGSGFLSQRMNLQERR